MVASAAPCVISDAVRSWCGFLGAGGDQRFSRSGSLGKFTVCVQEVQWALWRTVQSWN
jgi:hypothetical protein